MCSGLINVTLCSSPTTTTQILIQRSASLSNSIRGATAGRAPPMFSCAKFLQNTQHKVPENYADTSAESLLIRTEQTLPMAETTCEYFTLQEVLPRVSSFQFQSHCEETQEKCSAQHIAHSIYSDSTVIPTFFSC